MSSKLNKLRRNVNTTNRAWEHAVKRAFWMKNVTTILMFILTIINVCLVGITFAGSQTSAHQTNTAFQFVSDPVTAPAVKSGVLPADISALLSLKGVVSEGEYEAAVLDWFNNTYLNGNPFTTHNLKEDYNE
jgi:hypothetical protein